MEVYHTTLNISKIKTVILNNKDSYSLIRFFFYEKSLIYKNQLLESESFFFKRNSFNRMQEHFQINIFYSIRAVACIAVCLFFLEIEMIKHGLQNKNKDHVFGTYL